MCVDRQVASTPFSLRTVQSTCALSRIIFTKWRSAWYSAHRAASRSRTKMFTGFQPVRNRETRAAPPTHMTVPRSCREANRSGSTR